MLRSLGLGTIAISLSTSAVCVDIKIAYYFMRPLVYVPKHMTTMIPVQKTVVFNKNIPFWNGFLSLKYQQSNFKVMPNSRMFVIKPQNCVSERWLLFIGSKLPELSLFYAHFFFFLKIPSSRALIVLVTWPKAFLKSTSVTDDLASLQGNESKERQLHGIWKPVPS